MDPDAVDGAGRWLAVAALRGRWFVAEPACEDVAVGCAISGCPPTHASGSCILLVPWTVRSKRPTNALRRLRIDRASGVICLGSPSVDLPPRVHSRDDRSPDRRFGPERQPRRPRDTFRPRGFTPPRRLTPRAAPDRVRSLFHERGRRRIAACCRPGFAAFPRRPPRPQDVAVRDRGRTAAFPRRSYPPKMPSPAAVSCHHDRCLHAGSAVPLTVDGLESACADLHASVRPEVTASFEALLR